ncbi:MAG TPA: hypothetical protein VJR30_22450 [Bradyrhizobium sp.]|nr:hypothetical protein [Bradyrhizobium sp.]
MARSVAPPPLSAGADDDKDDLDDEEQFETAPPRQAVRMVDWLQCIKLPVGLIFSPLIIIVALLFFVELSPRALSKSQVDAIFYSSFALALLGPISFIAQIRGFAFNGEQDRLSFPRYVLRRSIRLSEIHDANCQTTTKPAFQITNTIIGLVSVGNIKGLGTTKRYFVNLSGDFGARRIVFHTKYKRDQFLSLLRGFAPQCRITRWV